MAISELKLNIDMSAHVRFSRGHDEEWRRGSSDAHKVSGYFTGKNCS